MFSYFIKGSILLMFLESPVVLISKNGVTVVSVILQRKSRRSLGPHYPKGVAMWEKAHNSTFQYTDGPNI